MGDDVFINLGSFDLTGTDVRDESVDLATVNPHIISVVDTRAEIPALSFSRSTALRQVH
jgi:hypothetical protein